MVIIQLDSEQLNAVIQNAVRNVLKETSNANQPDQKPESFIGINEAGTFLNLAKATIYGLVSAGKIPYMKQGKKLYFSKEILTQWILKGNQPVKDDLASVVDNAIVSAKRKRA